MSLLVDFTVEALQDLFSIARYTDDKWRREQAFRYVEMLNNRFLAIAEGRLFSKVLFPKYPQVWVCRCEHHYIFFMSPPESRKPGPSPGLSG